MARPKKAPVDYVDNKELHANLVKWKAAWKIAKAAGRELPVIPNSIGKDILLISQNLAHRPNFSGYSFILDMVGDGYENCVRYLHNFDPEVSDNPFGYITLIISRAFIRRIQREASHSYIRHKIMQGVMYDADQVDASELNEFNTMVESTSNDKSSDIISKFESDLVKKRDKAKINAANRNIA
jgi:hypothetical protein